MKNKYIWIVLILILLSPKILFSEEEKLKIEIDLYKTEFLLMEPIWFEITLTNLDTDTIEASFLCPECKNNSLSLELFNEQGMIVKYSGGIATLAGNGSTFEIESKQKFIKSFNLLEYFGNYKFGLFGRAYFRYLPTGEYTVRATQHGNSSKWKKFEIIEPQGRKKEEYDDMINAYIGKRDTKSNSEMIKYISNNPRSIYIEKILWDINNLKDIIELFPNSGYCNSAIKLLVLSKKNKGKQEFLQKIILNNPNSRSAKYAKQILNKHKQKKKEE